jgi:hypothetical protein
MSCGGKWRSVDKIATKLGDLIALCQSFTSDYSFCYSSFGNNT